MYFERFFGNARFLREVYQSIVAISYRGQMKRTICMLDVAIVECSVIIVIYKIFPFFVTYIKNEKLNCKIKFFFEKNAFNMINFLI